MDQLVGESTVNNVNNFTNNKFDIIISNFPNFTGLTIDLAEVYANIKEFMIPELSLQLLESFYLHNRRISPGTQGTRNLSSISMKIIADSALKNWYLFYSWIINTRNGIGVDSKNCTHDNCINQLIVKLKDNKNVIKSSLTFHNVFITTITDLSLVYGSAEDYNFTITMEYEYFDYKLEEI